MTKDINYVRQMTQSCIEELNAIGIFPNITADKVTINNRLKATWGRCWTHYDNYNRTAWHFTIEVSSRLVGDNVPENSLRSNLLHELLHACDECVKCGHNGKWKEYAELVSDCYNLNIQRCTSTAEYHVEDVRKAYSYKCSVCGRKFVHMAYRAPKWYKHPQGFMHTNCPSGNKKAYIMSEYYNYKLI